MSAAALLAELEAAGVRLSLAGDDLRFQTQPGVSITPYRECITAHKPGLLVELLQRRIIEAVTVEPAAFDRGEYDRLWALWNAHNLAEEPPCVKGNPMSATGNPHGSGEPPWKAERTPDPA